MISLVISVLVKKYHCSELDDVRIRAQLVFRSKNTNFINPIQALLNIQGHYAKDELLF